VFFYAKAIGAPLVYFADPLDPHGPGGRCAAVYLALTLILHLFVGHPNHDWIPSNVAALTPRTFEDAIMSDTAKDNKDNDKAVGKWKKVEWLVLFYANHDARAPTRRRRLPKSPKSLPRTAYASPSWTSRGGRRPRDA